MIKGVAKVRNGLYYLINTPFDQFHTKSHSEENLAATSSPTCLTVVSSIKLVPFAIWHHRLGHTSLGKLQHIDCVKKTITSNNQVCVTCPMAKHTKLPVE